MSTANPGGTGFGSFGLPAPRASLLGCSRVALIETAAIVLRCIDYGESDRVVTLMARDLGCVGAMARGARKSQRRFGGGLGLCAVGDAALRERSGSELFTLERFDVTASHPALAVDVTRIAHAAYAAELVTKLCAPRQAEPAIFDLLRDLLGAIDRHGAVTAWLRVFELSLLDRLGLAPVLDACAVCGREDLSEGEAIDVRWNPERGGVVCRACGSTGRPMRPVVRLALARLALARPALARLAEAEAPVEVIREMPEIAGAMAGRELVDDVAAGCRDALGEVIAAHLSAPLRSLEFLAKIESKVHGVPGA